MNRFPVTDTLRGDRRVRKLVEQAYRDGEAAGLAAGTDREQQLVALLREARHELLYGRVIASGADGWVSLPKRIEAALLAAPSAPAAETERT